jgi:hypothetical protein
VKRLCSNIPRRRDWSAIHSIRKPCLAARQRLTRLVGKVVVVLVQLVLSFAAFPFPETNIM